MHTSKIEWVLNPDNKTLGKIWNPITGCLNGCEYCYARKLAWGRLKTRYLANTNRAPYHPHIAGFVKAGKMNPFYPRLWEDRLGLPIEHPTPMRPAKRKGIFVCDMSDLFGFGIPESWTEQVMTTIKLCPYHRFYLLTKQPQNLARFSPFPPNVWCGVTAITNALLLLAIGQLEKIKAKVKFLSIEPLLYELDGFKFAINSNIDLVIIGALTGTKQELSCLKLSAELTLMPCGKKWSLQPKIEWVREIVEACDRAGVKVFLKDNLSPIHLKHKWAYRTDDGICYKLRQEIP